MSPHGALLGVLLAFATAAGAQDAAAPAEPVRPDPMRLGADWWRWFDAEGETLASRVTSLAESLHALQITLRENPGADGHDQGPDLIDEVNALAGRYVQMRMRAPAVPQPLPPTPQTYDLAQLREAGERLRETRLELEFERDDALRKEEGLAAANRQINDAKAAYLALDPEASGRLVAGLALMRDRLVWAVHSEELRLQKARIAQFEQRLVELEARVARAPELLAIDAGDRMRVEAGISRASALAARLRREAGELRLRQEGLGDAPEDRARARRQSQALLDYDVRIAHAELQADLGRLEQALATLLDGGGDEALGSLREARKALSGRLDAVQENVATWRRATDRERSAAAAQLALLEGGDAALGDLHRSRLARSDETAQSIGHLEQTAAAAGLLLEVSGERIAQASGALEDILSRLGESLGQAWDTLKTWSGASLFELNETPVTLLGLTRVALILVFAWVLARLVAGAIERLMQRRDSMSRASLYTLQRLSTYAIIAIGFLVGLSSIGIDFTKFALLVSALGVGLGFGLQAIFSNFVAGLIILFEKSLKVGDFVELESGVHGEVREINIRSTLITTNDNIDMLVPNSEFVNGRVVNWTLREAFRRLRVPFGVAYGTDKDLVKQAALEAAEAVPFTLKNAPGREPRVWLTEFGDSSLNFELVVWLTTDAVKKPATVQAAYTWELETALGRHGIEIPFPQRDLHVRSVFGRKDDDGLDLLPKGPALPAPGGSS